MLEIQLKIAVLLWVRVTERWDQCFCHANKANWIELNWLRGDNVISPRRDKWDDNSIITPVMQVN